MQNLLFLRPIESNRLTQGFGENQVCAKMQGNGIVPVRPLALVNKSGGTCPAGYRDYYRLIGMKGHNGGDWAAWLGEPVYHCGLYRGRARVGVAKDGALNADVISLEPLLDCTAGCPAGTKHYIYTRYSHNSKFLVKTGDSVSPGTPIASAGKSGGVTGVHVHWAPKYCTADGTGLHEDNGYEGAVDYNPFFENTFILDYLKQQIPPPPIVKPEDPPPPVPDPVPAPVVLSWGDLLRKIFFKIFTAFG